MIAQPNRFHGHNSLKTLLRRGRSIKLNYLALRHIANERRLSFRLAIVVSKKVDKKAVVRNRIRRRLFELCRRRLPNFETGVDLALIVYKNDLALMPASELEKLLQPLFAQLAELYPPRS